MCRKWLGNLIESNNNLSLSFTLTSFIYVRFSYDCGIFFTRSLSILKAVCSPTFDLSSSGPAYLNSSTVGNDIPSPLSVGIENSRRFRALPLYASLVAYGSQGYVKLFERNVMFARRVAAWLKSSYWYKVLNTDEGESDVASSDTSSKMDKMLNIVLFAPSSGAPTRYQTNPEELVRAINDTKKMYVTPTTWRGAKAIRLAVSNWKTGTADADSGDVHDIDLDIVVGVLEEVMRI
jgi:glutamate/tyrosine decarboxylase-like PLP-dependent enzyme